jgi:hypothetical protein
MSVGAIGVMWGSGRATIALSLSAPGADRPHRVRTGFVPVLGEARTTAQI